MTFGKWNVKSLILRDLGAKKQRAGIFIWSRYRVDIYSFILFLLQLKIISFILKKNKKNKNKHLAFHLLLFRPEQASKNHRFSLFSATNYWRFSANSVVIFGHFGLF